MGRRTAKKKVPPMPPLGFRDQCVYTLGYLLILAVLAGLFWFRFYFIEDRAMAEPGAVAYRARGSIFFYFPFFLCLMLSLFIPWQSLHSRRYPFFGKRGVKYGPPAYPRTFPLFMKNKPQYWKCPSQARMRRAGVIAVVVLNLLLALLLPLSIHGREMLYADGSMTAYSVFNRQKRHLEPEDAESVTLSIYWHRGTRHTHGSLRLCLTVTSGDGKFRFENVDFGRGYVDSLAQVLRCFDPETVQTRGGEKLDDFVRRLSPEDAQTLRELFELYRK